MCVSIEESPRLTLSPEPERTLEANISIFAKSVFSPYSINHGLTSDKFQKKSSSEHGYTAACLKYCCGNFFPIHIVVK